MTIFIPTIAGKHHDSGYIHLNIDMNEEERENHMTYIFMKQYALKIELKKSKERVESSVTEELTQLHAIETFTPVDATKINNKQREEAVASLMLLKVKLISNIKCQAYVDVIKQRETIKKWHVDSPTFATESVFMTAAVNAH